jgi:hypothetical protein
MNFSILIFLIGFRGSFCIAPFVAYLANFVKSNIPVNTASDTAQPSLEEPDEDDARLFLDEFELVMHARRRVNDPEEFSLIDASELEGFQAPKPAELKVHGPQIRPLFYPQTLELIAKEIALMTESGMSTDFGYNLAATDNVQVLEHGESVELGELIAETAFSRVFLARRIGALRQRGLAYPLVLKYQVGTRLIMDPVDMAVHPVARDFWFLREVESLDIAPKALFLSKPSPLPLRRNRVNWKVQFRMNPAEWEICVIDRSQIRFTVMERVGGCLSEFAIK